MSRAEVKAARAIITREQWLAAFERVLINARKDGEYDVNRVPVRDPVTMDKIAPVIAWQQFRELFTWLQGQHVGMIGPTGLGKTTLALQLLDIRKYVIAIGTKPEDPVLSSLQETQQYRRMNHWRNWAPELVPKRLLWPDSRSLYSASKQRKEIRTAIAEAYEQGRWCIFIDEFWYFIHLLGMELEARTLLLQARAMLMSMLMLTQRPAFVPLELYDQSTHLFFWRDNDERNLKRIGGINYRSSAIVRDIVSRLDDFQVLYVNRSPRGGMYRFTPPEIYTPGYMAK